MNALNLQAIVAGQGLGKMVLASLYGWDGEPVLRADIDTITRAIWYPGDTPLQQGAAADLTISSVLYDTWQTNAQLWPFDDDGFNFRDVIAGSLLSTVRTRQVQYTFTPADESEEPFGFEVLLQIRRRYGT